MNRAVGAVRATWRSWWSPYFSDGEDQPLWAGVVVTFLFSSVIALTLTAFVWAFSSRINLWETLRVIFLISLAVGFSILGLFLLSGQWIGSRRIDQWSQAGRTLFFTVVPLLGALIGYAVGFSLLGIGFDWMTPRVIGGLFLIWGALTLFAWRAWSTKLRLAEAQEQAAAERARTAAAQLRALQAQIEPHFLFNTLANVVSLIDAEPATARRMLERLIDLLRGTLASSLAGQATLGAEFERLRAYLDLLALRMGARLRCEIALPAELGAHPIPPMLLQPLVENAIQHGLEPKVAGGTVRVVAARGADGLTIVVEDDGIGFAATTRGGGVGLTNVRERLAAAFGERARLVIEDAAPGTRVRISLPMES